MRETKILRMVLVFLSLNSFTEPPQEGSDTLPIDMPRRKNRSSSPKVAKPVITEELSSIISLAVPKASESQDTLLIKAACLIGIGLGIIFVSSKTNKNNKSK